MVQHNMLQHKTEELRHIREQLRIAETAINEQTLKMFVVCALELYLTIALVISLFECPNPNLRDETELKYLMRVAWVPLIWGLLFSIGHKCAPSIAPLPENMDRNLRISKLITWVYSLAFLIYDKDMVIKQGPGLQVSILFCVCDLARYEMEVAQLIYEEEEEEHTEKYEVIRITDNDINANEHHRASLHHITPHKQQSQIERFDARSPTDTPSSNTKSSYRPYNQQVSHPRRGNNDISHL